MAKRVRSDGDRKADSSRSFTMTLCRVIDESKAIPPLYVVRGRNLAARLVGLAVVQGEVQVRIEVEDDPDGAEIAKLLKQIRTVGIVPSKWADPQ